MWKAAAGTQINIKDTETPDDDWDTDPDFINDVTEQEQRWGARTVEGSGRNAGAIDMAKLRKETEEGDALRKKKEMEEGPKAAFGYGGKFGVQADRMDRSAVGHDYIAKVEKHASQKDYSTGFGGKFGVQTDRVDKSAVNWDHKETVEKHPSQKDYSTGFGGKFGVQADRQDQSAVGWDHVEQMHKHESQKDYSVGFGGKFGVQSDRQDKCAVGWDHHEAPQKHESQTDHKIGFGGKFGVQTDRMDKSASSFNDEPERVGTVYTKTRPDIGGAKPSALRAKFEKLSEDSQSPVTEAPKPTTGKLNQAKTAVFTQPKQEEFKKTAVETAPKQLDQSKKDLFTKQQPQTVTEPVENAPKPLDQFRMKAFLEPKQETETQIGNHVPKKIDPPETVSVPMPSSEPVIVSTSSKQPETKAVEVSPPVTEVPQVPEQQPQAPVEDVAAAAEYVDQEETEITLEDTGLTAIALYDYQAAADDEISFDPDDIITHVEMIDEGWWRGLCRNQYGLFPANYVQLQQ